MTAYGAYRNGYWAPTDDTFELNVAPAIRLFGYGEVGLRLADEAKGEMYRKAVEIGLDAPPVYSSVGYF